MRIHLLGGVAIDHDGVQGPVTNPKQAAVLALLALNRSGLTAEALIDQVWDDDAPPSARKTLQNHIARLRKQLPDGAIASEAAGYHLDPSATTDVEAFEDEVRDARRARHDGELETAANHFTLAERMWRGQPFAGAAGCDALTRHRTLLEEMRIEAMEEHAAVRLDLGDENEVSGHLEALVDEHPLRERLTGLLMTALARTGRQAEALAAYQRLRSRLVDELGVDPSPELQAIEQSVLVQAPAVVGAPKRATGQAAVSTAFSSLPRRRTSFFGREDETDRLTHLLAPGRCVTVRGAGGVGKTSLALHTAARLAESHDGGAVFVDLGGVADPSHVVPAAARALGIEGHPEVRDVDRAPLWSEVLRVLAARPTLLVVDNCEHLDASVADFIESVLLDAPATTVLATSRVVLGLDGEVELAIDPLGHDTPDAPAVALLADRIATVADLVDPSQTAVLEEIAARLEGWPLALELAAARASHLSLTEIRDRLGESLALLRGGRTSRRWAERHRAMEASLRWSHDLLDDDERAVFRRFSVFEGGADLAAVESVTGGGLASPVVDVIGALVDNSLLVADVDGQSARYRMLEPIRQFAAARLVEADEHDAVRHRHHTHYLAWVDRVGVDKGLHQSTIDRISSEVSNLRAAIRWSIDQNTAASAIHLGLHMAGYFVSSGLADEAQRILDVTADAELDGVGHVERLAIGMFVRLFTGTMAPEETAETAAIAREVIAADGSWGLTHAGYVFLGIATLRDDPDTARAAFEVLLDHGELQAGSWLGALDLIQGDLDAAVTHAALVPEEILSESPIHGIYTFACFHDAGQHDRARSILPAIAATSARSAGFAHVAPLARALAAAAIGEEAEAWGHIADAVATLRAARWRHGGSDYDCALAIGLVRETLGDDVGAREAILVSGFQARMMAFVSLGLRALARIEARLEFDRITDPRPTDVVAYVDVAVQTNAR